MSAPYGELNGLVKAVGVLVSTSIAIGLTWRGRAKWEPSEEDISKGPQRVGGLLTAVAIALLWSLSADTQHLDFLTQLAVGLSISCALFLLIYGFLITTQTYTVIKGSSRKKVVRKIIGGFGLSYRAKLATQDGSNFTTVQEFLQHEVYDPDRVWSRHSRAIAKLCFVVCYLGLVVCGSIALACASIIFLVAASTQSRASGAPQSTSSKKPIHFAVVLNGDVHYTQDIFQGFRSDVDEIFKGSGFIAHFESSIGFAEEGKEKENEIVFKLLLKKFSNKPDYLVTIGTQVSEFAVQNYLHDIPIIFIGVTDPVKSHLVKELGKDCSRGNMGGVVYGVPAQMYLDFYTQAFPGKTFGFVYNPKYHQDVIFRDQILELAAKMKPPFPVAPIEVDHPQLSETQQNTADIFFGKYYVASNLQAFTSSSSKPIVGFNTRNINDDEVVVFGCDDVELGKMAARQIVLPNLIQGVALCDLPILVPTEPAIGVNLKAARRFGITVSQQAIDRAQRVVQ
jgi:putative ABC transport system substrate-binding protein